jgi:hypothetical protein
MWGIEWIWWGSASYSAQIGLLKGAAAHAKLKKDFQAQCTNLREAPKDHFLELERIRAEYEKLTPSDHGQ